MSALFIFWHPIVINIAACRRNDQYKKGIAGHKKNPSKKDQKLMEFNNP